MNLVTKSCLTIDKIYEIVFCWAVQKKKKKQNKTECEKRKKKKERQLQNFCVTRKHKTALQL